MSITRLMIEEHNKIESSLKKFLDNPSRQNFLSFGERVKRHFGVEKGVIFILTEKYLGEDLNAIFKLTEQHIEILKEIMEIKKQFGSAEKLISIMAKDLEAHKRYEEKVFYPKLDRTLDELQKEEIIERLRRVI